MSRLSPASSTRAADILANTLPLVAVATAASNSSGTSSSWATTGMAITTPNWAGCKFLVEVSAMEIYNHADSVAVEYELHGGTLGDMASTSEFQVDHDKGYTRWPMPSAGRSGFDPNEVATVKCKCGSGGWYHKGTVTLKVFLISGSMP